jgi:hypothetical protein
MAKDNSPILDQFLLRELFGYDGTGLYRKKAFPNAPAGAKAHKINKTGYLGFRVNGRVCGEHRLVWMFHHGFMPGLIDHINGNRADNRIENLRPATNSENICNSKLSRNNTSGCKGVTWAPDRQQWRVRIAHAGKPEWVGSFDSFEKACKVATKVRIEKHKQFANTGAAHV